MRYFFLLFLLNISFILHAQSIRVACWNVENYFDIHDDPLTNDDSFTPLGDYYWSAYRFAHKRNAIYKVLVAMSGKDAKYPAIIGLSEVENTYVLKELCYNTPLRRLGYQFIHYNSPDRRGIDCALLYLPSRFKPIYTQAICVSDSSIQFYTRDILLAAGTIIDSHDTCYCLVSHLPSRLGGREADLNRMKVAKKLKYVMDTLQQKHPSAIILSMGDFNADVSDDIFQQLFQFVDGKNPTGFFDLVYNIPLGQGTYKYQGVWSCIDHIISNVFVPIHIFNPPFLLEPDRTYFGYKIYRTYTYLKYHGGVSDHLPLYIDIPLK